MTEPIPASFYDADYFLTGTKSNYLPYGPGRWADDLADMITEFLAPTSVLDVGCAYGYIVERLRNKGIEAAGFDISEWAIGHSTVPQYTWLGNADDASSYPGEIDLLIATELPEHLTPSQSMKFLSYAQLCASRALLLIAMGEPNPEEHDLSHINIKQRSWWASEAQMAGWTIGDASAFNTDARSTSMGWTDRFMYLQKGK